MDATIIYPHQLFAEHPALAADRPVYLVEEPLLITHNPAHVQRLLLNRLSMQAYQRRLEEQGYDVHYLPISELPDSAAVFTRLARDGVRTLHIVDTTDDHLERAISHARDQYGFARRRYESPLFLLPKDEAATRYVESKRSMARFYKELRRDRSVLVEEDGTPTGGSWSFDTDNREKLPTDIELPAELSKYGNEDTLAAELWLETFSSERYGERGCWLPYTHAGAADWLEAFLAERFVHFGPYEDAITTRGTRLFHGALSPLLNIGLLTPQQVIEAALGRAERGDIPINSLEGFVRQVLGWREFMRAAYEVDGPAMRTHNFFSHNRPLHPGVWDATTGLPPLDATIHRARTWGYAHHIERLMVAGNYFLLTETDPDAVYRWFMGLFIDAYDWVMVPNVYGMSQFADGGRFATKPYISGASYLKKMSDHPGGDWEEVWTALYWRFIREHRSFFENNPRLAMMPKLYDRLTEEQRTRYQAVAAAHIQTLPPIA